MRKIVAIEISTKTLDGFVYCMNKTTTINLIRSEIYFKFLSMSMPCNARLLKLIGWFVPNSKAKTPVKAHTQISVISALGLIWRIVQSILQSVVHLIKERALYKFIMCGARNWWDIQK